MITPDELQWFYSMHDGFRYEFGRLADAFANPRSPAHKVLLDEQLALVLDMLSLQTTYEDENIWPFLIQRAPGFRAEIFELEAEHEELAMLADSLRDPTLSVLPRATLLKQVHLLVNDHLDHEEIIAAPLILQHYTEDRIAADRQAWRLTIGRRRLPLVLGWLASCVSDELVARTLPQETTRIRLMMKMFWWPAYARRFVDLYGPATPVPSRAVADSAGLMYLPPPSDYR